MRQLISRLGAALMISAVAGGSSAAQTFPSGPAGSDLRSAASGEVSTLAINAVLGGATAGVVRALHGRGSARAFARGAAGGALAYAGKRVAVERWPGAGLIGRQIHGVGASEIANAAAGRGVLQEMVFAAGPVHVYVDRAAGWTVQPRLDVVSAASLAYAATRAGWRLDLGRSVSAGAPVFHSVDEAHSPEGYHTGGVIRVTAPSAEWSAQGDRVVTLEAHERVHVLQRDMALLLVGAPVQHRLLRSLPGGRAVNRWLDLGVNDAAWLGLSHAVPYDDRPWERESYFLSNRPADHVTQGEFPGTLY